MSAPDPRPPTRAPLPGGCLPPLLAAAAGLGVLVFGTGSEVGQEGPAGDVAGAVAALALLITATIVFVVSAVTGLIAHFRGRRAAGRVGWRLLGALILGGLVGQMATSNDGIVAAATWALLLGGPAILSWYGRGRDT